MRGAIAHIGASTCHTSLATPGHPSSSSTRRGHVHHHAPPPSPCTATTWAASDLSLSTATPAPRSQIIGLQCHSMSGLSTIPVQPSPSHGNTHPASGSSRATLLTVSARHTTAPLLHHSPHSSSISRISASAPASDQCSHRRQRMGTHPQSPSWRKSHRPAATPSHNLLHPPWQHTHTPTAPPPHPLNSACPVRLNLKKLAGADP